MRNWSRRIGCTTSGLLAAGALLLMVACTNDLYQPCTLDANSPDSAVASCGLNDSSGLARSCAVDNQLQCDTRVCARYAGSSPFCTKKCTQDSDCPSGKCYELVFQSGVHYCVSDDLFKSSTNVSSSNTTTQ